MYNTITIIVELTDEGKKLQDSFVPHSGVEKEQTIYNKIDKDYEELLETIEELVYNFNGTFVTLTID